MQAAPAAGLLSLKNTQSAVEPVYWRYHRHVHHYRYWRRPITGATAITGVTLFTGGTIVTGGTTVTTGPLVGAAAGGGKRFSLKVPKAHRCRDASAAAIELGFAPDPLFVVRRCCLKAYFFTQAFVASSHFMSFNPSALGLGLRRICGEHRGRHGKQKSRNNRCAENFWTL